MRVAIVNQFSSAGGGSRFARALVMGLAQSDPASSFDFLADASAVHRDGLVELFAPYANVRILPLDPSGLLVGLSAATKSSPLGRLRVWALDQGSIVRAYRWVKFDLLGKSQATPSLRLPEATQRALDTYDVVYLAWPYYIEPLDVSAPVVATFHDFNFKHDFGNFTDEMLQSVQRDTLNWLESPVQPVSSTPFIAEELHRFYPTHRREPRVVFLSTFAVHEPTPAEVASTLSKHAIPADYLVCPSNTSPHKNLAGLFRALGKLKREGRGVPLVLTGFGTDDLIRLSAGNRELRAMYASTFQLHDIRLEEGLELGSDVIPLGFVSDLEMDALIRGALAVVAPSRYEAGSGPALDAWKLGTLVISSNIPPVLQQIDFLKTSAYLFDPDKPVEMASAIDSALADPDTAKRMVSESLSAMAAYTWVDVARRYLDVFRDAVRDDGTVPTDTEQLGTGESW